LKTRKLKESDIQRILVRWIKKDIDLSHLEQFDFTHAANEREHNQYFYTKMGVRKGGPDLTFVWVKDGLLYVGFLELKRKGNKLSVDQEEFLDQWNHPGIKKATAYSLVEAKNILIEWLDIKNI